MIPVSPFDYWLFIFEWDGKLYIDLFLPFGLRTAPFIFNLFSEGLHWISEWVFSRDLVQFITWTTSCFSMIQIPSSSVPLHHIWASQKTSRNGKMVGLSISQASNWIPISWKLVYQSINTT